MQGTLNIPVLPNAAGTLKKNVPSITPQDYMIVSYPRSGNTWVRFLLANLLEDSRYPLNFQQMQNRVPSIHSNDECRKIPVISSPRFIKSNMPYEPEYKKVIYIVRDGRDVMVSAYNYYFSSNQISFLDFLQLNIWPGPWHAHVLSWLDKAQQLDLLLVRYEDLLKNTTIQLKYIAHFIGLNTNHDKIDRAVRHSSFKALTKMEANQSFSSRTQPNLHKFFRTGKSGLWKQYFHEEHKTVFKPPANPVLARLGYITDPDW
jgi:hypothetical protein